MDVAAIGELLADLTQCSADGDGYPTLTAHPGGAPANYLAALAAFGRSTAFIGKVGDDAFGALLRGTLERLGVDVSGLVTDPGVFTTLAFVTLDDNGEREFSFARKPGADVMLRQEEVDLAVIDRAKVLHFGTLSLTGEPARSAVKRAVSFAKERGKLISFDPNYRAPLWPSPDAAREQILWGLAQTDVVKISDDEVDLLFGCTPEEGAGRIVMEYGVSLAMVTIGADGCILKNLTAEVSVRPPRVSAVDTTGAGDIFGGAAMARILEIGKRPEELGEEELCDIARFASAAAALSTEKSGGISSIPRRDQVETLCRLRMPEW